MIIRFLLTIFMLAVASAKGATILHWDFSTAPVDWQKQGDAGLFAWDTASQNLRVTWDSGKPNSFYSAALPRKLSIQDDFSCEFDLQLSSIAIGTSEGKPYTFQIAVGFFNSATSDREAFYIGSGTDSARGPRNLLEFNYFPDSGFGDTIAPIIVSKDNQIYYSHNFPIEMAVGNIYTIKMSFNSSARTLQSRILRNGLPDGVAGDGSLKMITLPARFADFSFDRFGISSYSDQGQTEQFAGSILAHGTVDHVKLILPDLPPPRITFKQEAGQVIIEVPSRLDFAYRAEASVDLETWTSVSEPITGTGNELAFSIPNQNQSHRFYRVRIERL